MSLELSETVKESRTTLCNSNNSTTGRNVLLARQ